MNSSTIVKQESFDKTISCRICMTQSSDMCNIFNSTSEEDDNPTEETIISSIEFCTGIVLKHYDCLPTRICKNCLTSLSEAYKFKTMCLLSEQMCQKMLRNIKVEPSDVIIHQQYNNDFDYVNDNVCDNNMFDDSNDNVYHNVTDPVVNYASIVKDEVIENFNVEVTFEEIDSVLKTDLDDLDGQTRQRQPKRRIKDEDSKNPNIKAAKQRKPCKKKVTLEVDIKKEGDDTKKTKKKVTKEHNPNKMKGPPRIKKLKYVRMRCEPCGIKFETRQESEQHKKDVHSNDPYVCELCGKTFLGRIPDTHVKSHQPAKFSCDSCDYRTAIKYDLKRHMRIHSGLKPYQCKLCPSRYRYTGNLREHEQRVHENRRPFECHVCQKYFYDRYKLKRHTDTHLNIKRYQCDLCRTLFTRRCYWRQHLEKQHSIVVPALKPGGQQKGTVLQEAGSANALPVDQ